MTDEHSTQHGMGSYYSCRLTKAVSSSRGHYLTNSAYQGLQTSAITIESDLKLLHQQKRFEVKNSPPYFGITDLKTQERYPRVDTTNLKTQESDSPNDSGKEAWDMLFNSKSLDVSKLAAHGFGIYAFTQHNFGLARAAFAMAVDLGHPDANEWYERAVNAEAIKAKEISSTSKKTVN